MREPGLLFTHYVPDPICTLLEFGHCHYRFQSSEGINGMAQVDGYRVDMYLASIGEDKERLRDFIRKAKSLYREIYIWGYHTPFLANTLPRYGFERCSQIEPEDEVLNGWKWTIKVSEAV